MTGSPGSSAATTRATSSTSTRTSSPPTGPAPSPGSRHRPAPSPGSRRPPVRRPVPGTGPGAGTGERVRGRLGGGRRADLLPGRCAAGRARRSSTHRAIAAKLIVSRPVARGEAANSPRPRRPIHALVTDAHPDPAGGPGGRRGGEPPAAGPRRLHPAADGGALFAAAAGRAGPGQGHRGHPAGDGPDRRTGNAAAHNAPGGDLAAQRALGHHGRRDVPADGPPGGGERPRGDPRGGVHGPRAGAELPPAAPAGVVPVPDQVPG